MAEPTYLLTIFAITFSITFALRAVPFAVLGTLQGSGLVDDLARWMPVGVLGILAVIAFRGSVVGLPGSAIYAVLALAVAILSTCCVAGARCSASPLEQRFCRIGQPAVSDVFSPSPVVLPVRRFRTALRRPGLE